MVTQVQIRGAVQATQEARTLASRELDVNTTDGRVVVHDGSTAGGIRHVNYKDQQNQEFVYASASGTDTITMSCAVAPGAYQAGQRFVFKAAATNTGSATLNVNSLGAKTIKKISSGALADVEADDIVSGGLYTCMYDGTYMQISGGAVGSGASGADIVYSATAASDASLGSTGIFSAGNSYEIEITNFTPTSNADKLQIEFHDGTNYINSVGDVYYALNEWGGTTSTQNDGAGNNEDIITFHELAAGVGSAANESVSGHIWVHEPAAGGEWVKITWLLIQTNGAGAAYVSSGGAQVDGTTTALTGFRVSWIAGNIESGKIVVREKPLS